MIQKMTATFFVESDEDPEYVAGEFSRGLRHVVSAFPLADVLHADVDSITPATEEEISEHGLKEE